MRLLKLSFLVIALCIFIVGLAYADANVNDSGQQMQTMQQSFTGAPDHKLQLFDLHQQKAVNTEGAKPVPQVDKNEERAKNAIDALLHSGEQRKK